MTTTRPRTLLVDDHPTFLAGLRHVLAADLDIVGQATRASEALAIAEKERPDVAFVDLHLPDWDGIALTAKLRAHHPVCTVIGLSAIEEPIQIARMLRAGAGGYVLKTQPASAMIEAVRCAESGACYLPPLVSRQYVESIVSSNLTIDRLTRREREVLELLLDGHSNDQTASALFISIRTVETHRLRIMRKLGVHTVVELVRLALRLGLRRQ